MTIPPLSADLPQWIEDHSATVDLLKWIIVGLLAWILGVFRYLRAKLKRPKLEIESLTSRCIWRELGAVDGNDHHAQVIFLIEAGVNNPTTDPIVVRDFTLQVKRLKRWGVKNHWLNAVTLPTRVQNSAGGVTKILKNWFSNFPDQMDSLTLCGRIESRDFQSAFLLFVSVSHGFLRPVAADGKVPIKLRARLTTGELLSVKSEIVIIEDHSYFESLLPGVIAHAQDRKLWNVIREQT